jgi:hypothetical protein
MEWIQTRDREPTEKEFETRRIFVRFKNGELMTLLGTVEHSKRCFQRGDITHWFVADDPTAPSMHHVDG